MKSILRSDSQIYFLGEAPGENEEKEGQPFVGYSGREFYRMLEDAGLPPTCGSIGNVFSRRPRDNNLKEFGVPKRQGSTKFPTAFQPATYLRPELEFELERLRGELLEVRPNIVCAMGNVALWALTGHTRITKLRGSLMRSNLVPGLKVLPTFHPAAVLREWTHRVVCIADFRKVARESQSAMLRLPERRVYIVESEADLRLTFEWVAAAPEVSVDIETAKRQITCVGFSIGPDRCVVIPFVSHEHADGNYWRTHTEEYLAWRFVRDALLLNNTKIFQNGLYDVQWFMYLGFKVNGKIEDTMIAHHALFSELPKGLDFIASTQCTEQAWKFMRARGDDASDKRDD